MRTALLSDIPSFELLAAFIRQFYLVELCIPILRHTAEGASLFRPTVLKLDGLSRTTFPAKCYVDLLYENVCRRADTVLSQSLQNKNATLQIRLCLPVKQHASLWP